MRQGVVVGASDRGSGGAPWHCYLCREQRLTLFFDFFPALLFMMLCASHARGQRRVGHSHT